MIFLHRAVRALLLISILFFASCKTESVIQTDKNQLTIEVGKFISSETGIVPESENASPFRPLPYAPPSITRNAKGSPTNAYWQQRADYTIDAELDTSKHRVKGKMKLRYFNFSPDALGYLWLQLDQNQLQPNGRVKLALPEPEDLEGLFSRKEFEFEGGLTLTNLEIQSFPKKKLPENPEVNVPLKARSRFPRALPKALSSKEMLAMESFKDTVQVGKYRPGYYINDTMLRVDLKTELSSNDSLEIVMEWEYPIQLTGRTGREELSGGWVYQIAQWYPRMCVYDDVNGWNTQQYFGAGEFYTEFGNFDVRLTVPATHICLATGTLQNPSEVLTPLVQSRLKEAKQSEKTVVIVGESELATSAVRPKLNGLLTWRYTAKNVRDFAWASSAAFIWDAAAAKIIDGARERSILAASLYPKEAAKIWKNSTQMVRESLIHLSRWMPYPYETMINVNGAVPGGMEYPMIIFCRERFNDFFLYSVTLHEIGHTWFPMVVQNDERRYAWMDEGLNSFLEHYGTVEKYPELMAQVSKGRAIVPYMLSENHQPLLTHPEEILDLGANAYDKASLSLITLREEVLGPEKFDFAFKEFIEQWKYKHPQPTDFFRTMENAAGEDLAWFWRGWYYTTALLDQSIDTVMQSDSLGKYYVQIELRNLRTMVMPVKMELTFEDGTTARKDLPVEIWFKGNRFLSGFFIPKKIKSILLDPEKKFPDINPENNLWNSKGNNIP